MNAQNAVRLVKIFVSSPADVAPERGRVQAIAAKLNREFEGLVCFETVLWEEHFYKADRSFQPQIPESVSCDVLVSIFWTRIGTELPSDVARMPDGKPYPSGTAYELLTALQASKSKGIPDVYVFRKTADMILPAADIERRRQAQIQLDALEAFWTEWFRSEQGHFKAAFQSFATTDDFERQIEQLLRQWLDSHNLLGPRLKWPKEKGSPFRGLAPFEAEHAAVFFGRDRIVDEARHKLAEAAERGSPFLLIVGASGSGKSSLARAGLIPRLTTPGVVPDFDLWRVSLMKPSEEGAGPVASLAGSLFSALPELLQGDYPTAAALADNLRRGGAAAARPVTACLARITEAAQRAQESDRHLSCGVVLLVDQFEELFAQTIADDERKVFAENLKELVATGAVWCIATLRADLYEFMLRQPDLKLLKERGASLDLGPPGPAELAEIVRAPATAAGLTYEANAEHRALDSRLLDDAKTADSLPLLQFTLAQLYDRRAETEGGATLTHAAYEALGGLKGAIAAEAERAVAALPPGALDALPRLLRQLAQPAHDGSTLTLRETPQSVFAGDDKEAALVGALLGARILIARQDAAGQPTLRLAHAAVLSSWPAAAAAAQASREFYRIRADAEDAHKRWQERGRSKDRLLQRGVPLAEAEKLAADFGAELPAELLAYIAASRSRARAQYRLIAASAVFFALLAAGATAGWAWAFVEQSRAQKSFVAARGAVDGLIFNISQGLANVEGVRTEAIARILETAKATVDRLVALNPNDQLLQNSRATMLFNFARIYARANDIERSWSNAQAALAAYRDLVRENPKSLVYQRNLALGLDLVARIQGINRGDLKGAMQPAEEALALRRQIKANLVDRVALANAIRLVILLQRDSGRIDDALRLNHEELAIRRELVAQQPDNADRQRLLADAIEGLAMLKTLKSDFQDANKDLDEALAIRKKLSAGDPTNTALQAQYAALLLKIGDAAIKKHDLDGARKDYEQSVAIMRHLSALDPQFRHHAFDLSAGLAKLAELKRRAGDFAGARADEDEVLKVRRKLVAESPENATYLVQLEEAVAADGQLQFQAGHLQDALARFEESVAILRKAVALSPDHAIYQIQFANRLEAVAKLRVANGNADGAQSALREAMKVLSGLLATNTKSVIWRYELAANHNALGDALAAQRHVPEAAKEYQAAFELFRQLAGERPDDPVQQRTLAFAYDKVGDVAAAQDDPVTAFKDYRAGLAIRQRASYRQSNPLWPTDLQQSVEKVGSIAFNLVIAKQFALALDAADAAIAVKPDVVWLYTNRAHALMFLGRIEEARALYLKYRDVANVQDGKSWAAGILDDFVQLRKAGLAAPLMDEVEKSFK